MLAACEMSGRVRDAFAKRGWEAWSADLRGSENAPQATFRSGDRAAPRFHGPERLGLKNNFHYQGDARDLFSPYHPVNQGRNRECRDNWGELPLWDLVLGFPPCTHLSLAGARYWRVKREWQLDQDSGEFTLPSIQDEAADFFMDMVDAPARYVAVENPRGDMTRRYRAPDQYVQPWWFGDALFKATGLWLKGLPLLKATHTMEDYADLSRVTTGGGSHRTDMRKNGRSSNGHEDSEGRARRHIVRNRTLPGLAAAMAAQWGPYIEERAA